MGISTGSMNDVSSNAADGENLSISPRRSRRGRRGKRFYAKRETDGW